MMMFHSQSSGNGEIQVETTPKKERIPTEELRLLDSHVVRFR
jgi:hypothetical protein